MNLLKSFARHLLRHQLTFYEKELSEARLAGHKAKMESVANSKKAMAYERIVRCVVSPAQIRESGMKSLEEAILFEKRRVEA
jgi:hypothetical protein